MPINSDMRKVVAKNVAQGNADYVGRPNEIVTDSGSVFIHDGLTPGGSEISLKQVNIINVDTDFTLELEHAGKYIRFDTSSPGIVYVPDNGVVEFQIGTIITIRQVGEGQISILEGSEGVILNFSETNSLRKAHSTACLIKVDSNEWDITGDFELVA